MKVMGEKLAAQILVTKTINNILDAAKRPKGYSNYDPIIKPALTYIKLMKL